MEKADRCKQMMFHGWHPQQCSRIAREDGFCKQHHPETVKVRHQKSATRWEEEKKQSCWYRLESAQKEIEALKARIAELENQEAA